MFRTEIPLIPHPQQLPQSARVLTIGSCFAETMGTRLVENKVAAVVNPFGTVFNPLTACQLLRAAAGEDMDWQQHLVEARGRWQSYDLHATIGADSPVTLLQRIQELVRETGEFLRTADVVMLTLGTAFVYRLRATGELVSNCHKVPAEQFDKELLTPDEIINAVAETHAYLRRHNPKLRFILTVSPVRHLKDTLPLNSVSKSALRLACHYLSELLPDVAYFPAYELLLDDLRDYRFYADDMLHPSTVAQEYIWERLTRTYFDAAFGRFKKEWHALRQALHHRPLYEAAPEHRQFLETTLDRLRRLGQQVDVNTEIDALQQQLLALPLPTVPEPEPEPEDDEERIDIGEYADAAAAAVMVLAEPVEEVAQPEQEPEALPTTPIVEQAEAIVDEATAAQPKKKRRSRGGAKRTARKRAALEALATQETTQTLPVEAVDIDVAEPTLASTAVPEEALAATEEQETPVELTVPVIDVHEAPEIPAEETEASGASRPRKGRTAGQILADKKKARRSGKSRGRQLTPLYATPENEASDSPDPRNTQPTPTPDTAEVAVAAPTLPAVEAPVVPVTEAVEAAPILPEAAPTPTIPVAETAPAEVSPATDDADTTRTPAEPPAPESAPARRAARAKAPAKPRASRSKKPAATPEIAPTPEPAATAPKPGPFANPTPAKPKATRKKATKPTAVAEATPQPVAEPPTSEVAPTAETTPAAPKRRSRPARKKPTPTDDDTPAA